MPTSVYNDNVFINCPFDDRYKPLFNAIVFAVHDCGFAARSAQETEDGSQVRIDKIYGIIAECRYGIHDISRTELDEHMCLPRFNMPLELGVFLGAKRYGEKDQQKKSCLILDKEPFRYQIFVSDIAGQDVKSHNNNPKEVVHLVRDWLSHVSKRKLIPSGNSIWNRYQEFQSDLPRMVKTYELDLDRLIFTDYVTLLTGWLEELKVLSRLQFTSRRLQ